MNVLELFKPIRTFVFAAGGVITDNAVYVSEQGQETYRTSRRDAYAMRMALNKGYKVYITSHNQPEALRSYLSNIGITDIHFGIENKLTFVKETGSVETILYMASDLPDHATMQLCALPCCPSDAVEEIKAVSKYISPLKGGEGCIRDVIEKVMKLNGDWETPVA